MVSNTSTIDLEAAFRSFNIIEAANNIIELYLEDTSNFKKKFLHLNFIKEPISPKFSEADMDFMEKVITEVILKTEEDPLFIELNNDIREIFFSYYSIYRNLFSNNENLNRLKISSLSLKEQLYCILSFISNKLVELNKHQIETTKNLYTGSEINISKFKTGNLGDLEVSYTEIFDTYMESCNTLIPYLYFIKQDSIEDGSKTNINLINKDKDQSEIKKLIILAQQRWMLTILWARFKYSNYNFKYIDNFEDNKIFLIEPSSSVYELEKNIFIGGQRLAYHQHVNMSKSIDNKVKEKLTHSMNYVDRKLSKHSLKEFLNISKEEYKECIIFAQMDINSQEKLVDPYYTSIDYKKKSYDEIIKCIEFILTVAFFMDRHSKNNLEIINLDLLVKSFSYLYSLDIIKARNILNLFISKPKEKTDLFSKPLIYCGNSEVLIFSEFVNQINIPRIFDVLIKNMRINNFKKGITYENELREVLTNANFINVNTANIKFEASDGKDVEYDFLGYFNEYLIIMEFKNCFTPYSNKEYDSALDTMKFGIEQVNRRQKILHSDWHIIKKLANIELPTEPPKEEKIIKILCTNIYHFTSLKINDVFITDSSALIKFFYYPMNSIGISGNDLTSEYVDAAIWSTIPPSVEDFRHYLQNPSAMKEYRKCVDALLKPIISFKEGDPIIYYHDFSLIEDPYRSIVMTEENKKFLAKKMFDSKRIGRNDKCFCRSNKKFKYCCLKLLK
ncbi:SEC-C metal-binding domain-containing protein [Lysinibacillus sp. NPDC093197]|uniref:SEC-C metal-binding domain-containing protein n=1 Tax=Lysinibacillus sp. NPDC093197 TaxID=3364132 RepID=UPI00380ACDBA